MSNVNRPISVFAAADADNWIRYAVTLAITDRLAGSLPKESGSIAEMIRRRWSQAFMHDKELTRHEFTRQMRIYLTETGRDPDEVTHMTDAAIMEFADQKAEGSTNVFRSDENGLYMPSHSVKSMLKEAINITYAGERFGPTKKGGVGFIAERVFIEPDRLYIGKLKADGIDTVHGTVSGQQGPRAIVTAHEYVERPVLHFIQKVMTSADIDISQVSSKEKKEAEDRVKFVKGLASRWPAIWNTCEHEGLGSLRSRSEYGRFVVTRFDKLKVGQEHPDLVAAAARSRIRKVS